MLEYHGEFPEKSGTFAVLIIRKAGIRRQRAVGLREFLAREPSAALKKRSSQQCS